MKLLFWFDEVNRLDILALVNNRIFEPMRDGEKYIIRSIMIDTLQHWGDQIKNERCKGHVTRMGETRRKPVCGGARIPRTLTDE